MRNERKYATNNRNKTYNRNHHNSICSIYKIVCGQYGRLTWRRIAELAGITRQTLYKHFSDIDHLFRQGVADLLNDFRISLDLQWLTFSKMFTDNNESVFYILLTFLSQQGDIFTLICGDLDHQELLYLMVLEIFPRLRLNWLPVGAPTPDIKSERVSMAIRMMVEVISRWGVETRCNIRKADRYVQRLMKVADFAAQNRLP